MIAKIQNIIEHKAFNNFITAVIILNAITLGLETNDSLMSKYGKAIIYLDGACLAIFLAELIARLSVYKFKFLKSGWGIFDFTIVATSLIPAQGSLAILRAFRILRVLRLFSIVPQMRRVINALFHAIPGMISVVSVLMIVFYVSAVLTTKLFGDAPNEELQMWFGTIGASMYTLFQIMTLESWSMGIVRPTLELYPWAWGFFVPFIIVTSFAVLNLFIGIIVDSMQRGAEDEKKAQYDDMLRLQQQMMGEILQLRHEVSQLKPDTTTHPKQNRAA